MIKKKFALLMLSCLFIAGSFAGCQGAANDVSETMSKVGEGVASTVSRMESAFESTFDHDRNSSVFHDDSSLAGGNSRLESSGLVSHESSIVE